MRKDKTNKSKEKSVNVYEMVTKEILKTIARGTLPWRQTWTARKGARHPFTNRFTGKPYSFLNTLLLGTPGEYATFNQIKEKKGSVKKGAKSKIVIYWGEFIPKENKERAEELEREGKDISHLKVRFPKYYRVFSMDDVEGIEPQEAVKEPAMKSALAPTDIAEMAERDYIISTGVNIDRDSDEPGYDALTDTVSVPSADRFTYEEDFHAALLRELAHSTAAEGRCDRKREMEAMESDEASVKEELIAEIASSMCLSAAGLERRETKEQIAAECERWARILGSDHRLIVNASYGAEKAAKLILGEFAE